MKRIYTRTGDAGTTGIHGGERVAKDDVRIEANEALHELKGGVFRQDCPKIWSSIPGRDASTSEKKL